MDTLKTCFDEEIKLGEVDGDSIYLSPPSWDCNWYWGFGYLGNKNCHYHVDGLTKHEWYDTEKNCSRVEYLNLYDGIKKHFGDTLHPALVKDDHKKLWTFCELMTTFYKIREYAEVVHRGGANYTTNPHSELIKNDGEYKRINHKVLPAIFDSIWYLFNNKI